MTVASWSFPTRFLFPSRDVTVSPLCSAPGGSLELRYGPTLFGKQAAMVLAGLQPGVCSSGRLCCNLCGPCLSAERG